MNLTSYEDNCDDTTLIRTGVLPESMTPVAVAVSDKTALVYNPGTERTPTVIRLSGDVGEGLLIRNYTTGQHCRIQG